MKSFRARPFLAETCAALGHEMRQLRLHDARAALCAQTVVAVLLAWGLADVLQLTDRWWAVLSAFVVVRAEASLTRRRGLERMAGTLAGAIVGVAVGAALGLLPRESSWLYPLLLATVAGGGLYATLSGRHPYFWALATVSTVMVLADLRLDLNLAEVALTRIADVAVGVAAAWSAAALMAPAHRNAWLTRARHPEPVFRPSPVPPPAAPVLPVPASVAVSVPVPATVHGQVPPATTSDQTRPGSRSHRLRGVLALYGAVVVAVLGAIYHRYPLADLGQSLVSVIAVLIVPLAASDDADPHARIGLKMLRRILGCLSAAVLALLLLPLLGGHALPCALALSAGVWIAAHLQAGPEATGYIGTQFGVGFIMVFVQDHAGPIAVSAAAHRLLGMTIGLAGLGVVLLTRAWLGSPSRSH
ncbi:MAG TPA: FUSC family protein [Stenotrophomonas sp.]|jgi:uncharacterized membrane protein YccC